MVKSGEAAYQPFPLPDRVHKPDDPAMKARILAAAGEEEAAFYAGGAGDECLAALEPIGTSTAKPHLPVGWPADHATVPEVAKRKKPLAEILSVFRG